MNELEKFYVEMDESDLDYNSEHIINSKLQQVSQKLFDDKNEDILKLSELERQGFAVRKSFDIKFDEKKGTLDGLSWQMSGTQKMVDGSEKPLYWPNIQDFSEKDFEYFENRFKKAKNTFIKVEYGLMVYFGSKTPFSKHHDFKKELFAEILKLAKLYYAKALIPQEVNHNVLYFISNLTTAYQLAEKSKLPIELNNISAFIFETHKNWDVHNEGTLKVLLELSGIMLEYFKHFKKLVNFDIVLEKNIEGAKELEKSYKWGAIYLIDKNIEIKKKLKGPFEELIRYKAQLYEQLIIEAEEKGNMACISFSEDTLRLYQQINDTDKIDELEKRYNDLRGKFELGKIQQELPQEYMIQINNSIHNTINESNEKEVLLHFILTPWYSKIANIEKQTEEAKKHSAFLSLLGTSILDKFGNTIDNFHTEEEIKKHNFWQNYGLNFQIGTQIMHKFFIQAFNEKKITFDSVITHLQNSWFNEPILRNYYGETVEVIPVDLIKPGIKRFFEELDKFTADSTYTIDYVTVTDSLVLKIESIIRFFCEKIGIATFKTRQKGLDKLVMEKLLDDLLVDVKNTESNPTGFDEEDRIFIKYILTEKAGLNLRNQVAHGLLDYNEYVFSNQLLIISIILKLSKYTFSPIQ